MALLLSRRPYCLQEDSVVSEEHDVPTSESMPVVGCEPAAAADGIDERRMTSAPAIAEVDEREEAGYGYGV